MNFHETIEDLRKGNITLDVLDDQLKVKAPKGKLDAKKLDFLKKNKQALIDYLSSKEEKVTLSDIEAVEEQDHYPVSSAQKRLWTHDQSEEGNGTYLIVKAFKLSGIDPKIFEQVWSQVVRDYDILRSYFVMTDGVTRQKFLEIGSIFTMTHMEVGLGELDDFVYEQINIEKANAFDLSTGPLWRAKLIKAKENDFVFLLSIHHVITDGWSLENLFGETLNIYRALQKNTVGAKRPKLQYQDYAIWQQELLKGKSYQLLHEYWKSQLSNLPANVDLSTRPGRPAIKTWKSQAVEIQLGDVVSGQLRSLSTQFGASLFMTLLATVKAFIYRYSRKGDLVIGSPVSGRLVDQLADQQGFFVNMLPIRSKFDEKTTFGQLIQSVKETLMEALDHQVLPFEEMVELSGVARDTSRSPIFDIVVQIQEKETKQNNHVADSVSVTSFPTGQVDNFYDLTFLFEVEKDRPIVLKLEYNTDIFSDQQMDSLKRYYSYFLSNTLRQIDQPVSRCELMSQEERDHYIFGLNQTANQFTKDKCLHTIFEEVVRQFPTKVAVKDREGSFTYNELNSKANQVARFIQASIDEKPGGLIGLLVKQNRYAPLGIMGILKAGFAYIPIDPTYPIDRQQYILEHANVQAVITDDDYPVSKQHSQLKFLNVRRALLDQYKDINPIPKQRPEDRVYILYTSGSTGRPKGVVVEHHALVNTVEWVGREFHVSANDRIICLTSICFDISVYDFFGGLLSGASIYMVCKEDILDSNYLKALLTKEKITIWNTVPTTMASLIEELEKSEEGFYLESLKNVFLGGDWLPVPLPGRIRKFFPNATVVNMGGATETTVFGNSYTIHKVDKGQKFTPYGKPIANLSLYILDDYLRPVPEGRVGEIYHGGVGIARGYLNNPELTNRSFIPDPFHPHKEARLYKTGDLGRWMEDGNAEFIGRKDFQVKIRGHRVELGEIENALIKHPNVIEAVVIHKKKEKESKLVAYYTPKKNEEINDLRKFLKEMLPEYMVPQYLIALDQFPLSENGKIDRKELMQRQLPVLLEDKQGSLNAKYEIEEQVLWIWEEVLGKRITNIHANFFELGGHSLQITRIIALLYQKTGVNFPVRSFFLNPTIYDISRLIREEEFLRYDPIKKVPKQVRYKASHAQKRLWLGSKYEQASIAFNVPGVYEINGLLDNEVLKKVMKALIERHEILRTGFAMVDDELYQVVEEYSDETFSISIQDASKWKDQSQTVRNLIDQQLKTVFDLEVAPLIKVTLFKLSDDRYIMCILMHHIVTDGWSAQVLIEEFWKLYDAIRQYKESPLETLKIQYKDYAEWHNNWLSSDQKNDAQKYWEGQFQNDTPVLKLPVANARPKVRSYEGGGDSIFLEQDLFEELQRISRKQGVSLYSTVLTLFNTLFYAYTGQKDLVVGVLAAGRDHPDLENQVGYYINNLPLRVTLDTNNTFEDTMARVADKVVQGYQNQWYPFDLIVRDSRITPDSGRSPLFDVMIQMLYYDYQEQLDRENTNISISDYDIFFPQTRYDLEISLQPAKDGLVCEVKYNSLLLEAGAISLLLERFKYLSQKVVTNTYVTIDFLAQEMMNYFPISLASEYEINHLFWYEKLWSIVDQHVKASKSGDSAAIAFEGFKNLTQVYEVPDNDFKHNKWLYSLMTYAFLLHKYGNKKVLLNVHDKHDLDPEYFLYDETSFMELDALYHQTLECIQTSTNYGEYAKEKLSAYFQLNTSFDMDQIGRFGMIREGLVENMDRSITNYDLLLVVKEKAKSYTLHYNTEVYDELIMNRFAQHFEQTLEFVSEGVEQIQNELENLPV